MSSTAREDHQVFMSDQPRKRKAHAVHDSSLDLASQSPSKRRRPTPEAGSPNVDVADKPHNKKTGFERKTSNEAQHEDSSVESFDGAEPRSMANHKIKEVTRSPEADDSIEANTRDPDVNILKEDMENSCSPTVTTVTKTKKTTTRNEISTVRDDPVTGERITTTKKTSRSRKTTTTSTSRDRKRSYSGDPKKTTTIKEISTVQEDPVTGECITTTKTRITSKKTTTTSTSKDQKRKHLMGPNRYASNTPLDIRDRSDETTAQGETETTPHGLAINPTPRKRSAEPYDPSTLQEPAKKRRQSSDGTSTPSSKRVCADAACDQDAESYDEIKPGAMRLLLKDNRKSLLESPEATPMQENLDMVSWMSEIEEVMWSQEEEQYTAEAWVRDVEEETARKEEEEEIAETESRRIAAEAETKRRAQSLNVGQSRFEKLPQEIRDEIYGHVLHSDTELGLQFACPELLEYERLRVALENLERDSTFAATVSVDMLEEMAKLHQDMGLYINPSNQDTFRKGHHPTSEFRLFDTSIFRVNSKIYEDAQAIFYERTKILVDAGPVSAERINGYWNVSLSETSKEIIRVARHLTIRIPYTFLQQTVDLLHDRQDLKFVMVFMCVPQKEESYHWHKLDYWIEPLKLFRHIRAEFFRIWPLVWTETINVGMYRPILTLPFKQIWQPIGQQKFFVNLADVVEGRPPTYNPGDVYPETAKGQMEGTHYEGVKLEEHRKMPRIGPWT